MEQTAPSTDKLLLTVDEAATLLGLHRSRMWPLFAQKKIRSLKIGKSRRIPRAELEHFIADELASQYGE